MKNILSVLALFAICLAPTHLMAKSPQERAAAIKTWRAQCNDPDPDLRLAYLEAALETKDNTIIRTCSRLAINSDNADLRNLGLRALLAAKEQIIFEVTRPEVITNALAKAGDDEDALEKIWGWYISRAHRKIQNGMIFVVEKATMSSSSAQWIALGARTAPHKDYRGKAVIVGDRLTWSGKVQLDNTRNCQINVLLQSGARLVGTFVCDDLSPFPIHVDLI